MSTIELLKEAIGEERYRAMPAWLKRKFKKLDKLPAPVKPLTYKRLEAALR